MWDPLPARPGRTDTTDVASAAAAAAVTAAAPAIATRVLSWLLPPCYCGCTFSNPPSVYILLINDYGDEMIPVVGLSNVVLVGHSKV